MVNIYKSWFLIFLILSIDIIFELSYGYNLIGNSSYMESRIASFFGDELVAGAFYHGFVLFFLSYLVLQRSKNYILILSIILVLLLSFLIGERSNFIKLLISVTIFSSLIIALTYLGAEDAQLFLQIPSAVGFIFQGLVLFYLLGAELLINYKIKFDINR